MFKHKGHGFFCRCEGCKFRRKTSLWYMGSLIAFLIIIFYQTILLIFFTTKINALILLILMTWLVIGVIRILF